MEITLINANFFYKRVNSTVFRASPVSVFFSEIVSSK